MLKFTASHGIKPMIEAVPMSQPGVTDAMTKLKECEMWYRGVLVAATA